MEKAEVKEFILTELAISDSPIAITSFTEYDFLFGECNITSKSKKALIVDMVSEAFVDAIIELQTEGKIELLDCELIDIEIQDAPVYDLPIYNAPYMDDRVYWLPMLIMKLDESEEGVA